MRNRTLLLAKRTVWSGRVHKSRFHGALPAGSQVITDQRSWLRFWRTLHDDTPAPQINFGEDFVHIAAHDSNDPNPPTPNLAIYNPPGELRVEQVFRAIYYPPTPPAKTLTVKITLYSRDGIRKFPAENLQPGPP